MELEENGNILIIPTVTLHMIAHDSDFWFSQGHRLSYDSAYDFDSNSRKPAFEGDS